MQGEIISHKENLTDHFRRIAHELKSGVLRVRHAGETWQFFCLLGEIRAATIPSATASAAPPNTAAFVKKLVADLAVNPDVKCLFSDVQEKPPETSWLVNLPVQEVLVEIGRALPDLTALQEAWIAAGERFASTDAHTLERAAALLSPEEMFVLSRFDAPMTLAELLAISPFPSDQTVRYFYILYLLGMVAGSPDGRTPPSGQSDRGKRASAPPDERKTHPPGPAPATNQTDWLTLQREIEERSYLISHGNYYDLLNVRRGAGPEDIKNSYYALAKRFHPDLHQAAVPKAFHEQLVNLFCHLGEAYETLSDPEKRSAYDQRLRTPRSADPTSSGGAHPASQEQIAQESSDRGEELFQQKEYAKALPYLREATRLKPGRLKFRIRLAQALSEIPQHRREAEEEFRKSIELDPNNADSYVALGHFYKSIHLPSRAQKCFLQALEHDPSHSRALEELGRNSGKSTTDKTLGHRFKKLFSKK